MVGLVLACCYLEFLRRFGLSSSQSNLPRQAVLDILTWCRAFPENDDAVWRLARIDQYLARPSFADEFIDTSHAVLSLHLGAQRPLNRQQQLNLTRLFSLLHAHSRRLPLPDPRRRQVDGFANSNQNRNSSSATRVHHADRDRESESRCGDACSEVSPRRGCFWKAPICRESSRGQSVPHLGLVG